MRGGRQGGGVREGDGGGRREGPERSSGYPWGDGGREGRDVEGGREGGRGMEGREGGRGRREGGWEASEGGRRGREGGEGGARAKLGFPPSLQPSLHLRSGPSLPP